MLSIFVLCLIGVVVGQVPRPCTTTGQWEAHVHSSNPKLEADLRAEVSYDSVYQRTRVLQRAKVGQTETYYNIITLYAARLVYYVNMITGECSHYTYDEPWHDFGVQSDAKSLGEAYIGSPMIPDAALLVTIWFVSVSLIYSSIQVCSRSGNKTLPINQTASYIETWTYKECLPVYNIVFEPNNIVNYMWYYNITLGIKDIKVFIPPDQCLTDEKYPIEYTHVFSVMNKK
jgi:hypothetical protein